MFISQTRPTHFAVFLTCSFFFLTASTLAADEFLDAILGKPPEPRPVAANCGSPGDPLEFRKDAVPYRGVCGDYPRETVALLCQAAADACRSKNPLADAVGLCANSNSAYQRTRANSGELRAKVEHKAREFFHSSINDEGISELCCQSATAVTRESCKKAFAATKLVITTTPGAPSEYSFAENAVYLSRAHLLQFLSEEGVERLVLHELGHACMRARHNSLDAGLAEVGSPRCNDSAIPVLKSDVEAMFGPKAASCVVAAIQAAGSRKQICRFDWMHEAFADAVSYTKRSSLTHWAWDCSGAEDRHHGPPQEFIACFTDTAPLASLLSCATPPTSENAHDFQTRR